MRTLEAVIAGLLTLGGLRSLVHWLRRPFHPATPGERMLYVLNLTGRIGWWFALAGFFLAWAVVDEPQSAGWFLLLPIALAGVQLLTGFLLAHREDDSGAPTATDGGSGGGSTNERSEAGADSPASGATQQRRTDGDEEEFMSRSNGHGPFAGAGG